MATILSTCHMSDTTPSAFLVKSCNPQVESQIQALLSYFRQEKTEVEKLENCTKGQKCHVINCWSSILGLLTQILYAYSLSTQEFNIFKKTDVPMFPCGYVLQGASLVAQMVKNLLSAFLLLLCPLIKDPRLNHRIKICWVYLKAPGLPGSTLCQPCN